MWCVLRLQSHSSRSSSCGFIYTRTEPKQRETTPNNERRLLRLLSFGAYAAGRCERESNMMEPWGFSDASIRTRCRLALFPLSSCTMCLKLFVAVHLKQASNMKSKLQLHSSASALCPIVYWLSLLLWYFYIDRRQKLVDGQVNWYMSTVQMSNSLHFC